MAGASWNHHIACRSAAVSAESACGVSPRPQRDTGTVPKLAAETAALRWYCRDAPFGERLGFPLRDAPASESP